MPRVQPLRNASEAFLHRVDGRFVALAMRPEALADDCTRAAVIVTAKQAPPDCGALVIGQKRLQKQAAISLRRVRDGFAIDAVRPNGVDRPWSPAVDDQTEPENSTARPARPAS